MNGKIPRFSRKNILKQVYEWNTSNFWSICKPDKFDADLCKKANVTFTGKLNQNFADNRTFLKDINREKSNVYQ